MEAEFSPAGSADGSLGDPYDMAMAQMQAHMLIAEDGEEDLHSLDAASERSDEELRIIMDPESRMGFMPVTSAAPAAKVARGSVAGRRGSGKSGAGARGSTAGGRAGDGAPTRGAGKNKENKTRARARKAHEPDPFLSIDTLPTDKARLPSAPSREHSASSNKGSSVAARRKQMINSNGGHTRAPPGTPSHPVFNASRSRMGRSASSAVSSEWNPLVPKHKHLSAAALDNPINTHVKVPFKHTVHKPDLEKAPRPMTPSQTMKERTMLATFHLARTMARQRGEEDEPKAGRLLKGRLKPLYPVRVEGPSIEQCKGVVAGVEFEDNSLMNSNSKTLARRRKIMAGMLNKDFLYERPPTAESLHPTSVASDLSEGREKDLDDMEVREKNVDLPTPPQDGMREPPNSLASASDPNFRHNMTTASNLSSDVFEIDEIPKTSSSDRVHVQNTIEEGSGIESTKGQSESNDTKRPSTAKAVRFAESEQVSSDANGISAVDEQTKKKEEPEQAGGCKPKTDGLPKKDSDEDPDGHPGPDQGKSNDGQSGGQSQNVNQGQTEGQTQNETQGQGNSEGNNDNVEGDPKEEEKVTRGQFETDKILRASYNTILYTTEEVKFTRMGSAPPIKPKKKPSKKNATVHIAKQSSEDVSDFAVTGEGKESPRKDYYDQFPRRPKSAACAQPRPQSAKVNESAKKKSTAPVLLRRPISASVPAKGKEPKVQFVIKPNVDGEELEVDGLEAKSPRLNEMKGPPPMSARTQTSGVPSSARGSAVFANPMEQTVRRAKVQQPAADFKVEGAKMAKTMKTGVCTVCGKSTNKIAEYWEETGALVCDVCDRRTRAEEERKINWIRKQMGTVYRGECNDQGEPIVPHLMLKDTEETGALSNLDDLDKALEAVQCEINEALKDVQEGVTLTLSEEEEESDDEEEELLALTYDEDTHRNTPKATINETLTSTEEDAQEEEPEKITSGEISKILTEINADPSTLSEYEMRVYWYKEYSQHKDKETAGAKASPDKSKKRPSSGQVYEDLRRVMGQQSENGEISTYSVTMMADQTKDPVTELLGQNTSETIIPASKVQHFKGQRVSNVPLEGLDGNVTGDGDLGVAGTAAKLTRSRSAKKAEPEAIAPFAPLCFRINARPPPGFLYYFAYGADMNPDRMKTYIQRPVDADRLWGLLYGFRLVFNKRGTDMEAGAFPNIELHPSASVEGCLYLITLEELDKIDRQVGYPQHYDHAMLPVWLLNCSEPEEYGVAQYCVPALVFVAKDKWIHKGGAPLSSDYAVDQCMKGGGNILTPAYQEHLTALKT